MDPRLLASAAFYIFSFAAQVSGYSSPGLALALAAIATLLLIWSAAHRVRLWHQGRVALGRPGVEPSHLIVIGAAGAWLFLTIAIAGVIWQQLRPAPAIGEMRAQLDSLQQDFNKYIAPRTLSGQQTKLITDYLLPRDHHAIEVYFDNLDQESSSYAGQLFNALREGGWDVTMKVAVDGKLPNGGPLGNGLQMHVILGSGFKGGTPKAMELLDRAFAAAKVRMDGGGTSGQPGAAQKAEDTNMLLVGHRPLVITPRASIE